MQFGRYVWDRSEMKGLGPDPLAERERVRLPDGFWEEWSGNTWASTADYTPPGLR